jgi:hypothetical protein
MAAPADRPQRAGDGRGRARAAPRRPRSRRRRGAHRRGRARRGDGRVVRDVVRDARARDPPRARRAAPRGRGRALGAGRASRVPRARRRAVEVVPLLPAALPRAPRPRAAHVVARGGRDRRGRDEDRLGGAPRAPGLRGLPGRGLAAALDGADGRRDRMERGGPHAAARRRRRRVPVRDGTRDRGDARRGRARAPRGALDARAVGFARSAQGGPGRAGARALPHGRRLCGRLASDLR